MWTVRNQLFLRQCGSVRLGAFATGFSRLPSAFRRRYDKAWVTGCCRRAIVLRLVVVEGARTMQNFATILVIDAATLRHRASKSHVFPMHGLRTRCRVELVTSRIWCLGVHKKAGSLFVATLRPQLMWRFLSHCGRSWWHSVSCERLRVLQNIGRALRINWVVRWVVLRLQLEVQLLLLLVLQCAGLRRWGQDVSLNNKYEIYG